MYEADAIKGAVTMTDICNRYGIEIENHHFVKCPFHAERTASMKIYPGSGGYHCFGCGAHGDVIRFVQTYFGLSFVETLHKIDADFSLGLFAVQDEKARRDAQLAEARRKREREIKRREAEAAEQSYWHKYDEVLRLREIVQRRAPRCEDDKLDPTYTSALTMLAAAECELEIEEARRHKAYGDANKLE